MKRPTEYSDENVDIVEPDLTEQGEHLVHDHPTVQLVQDLKGNMHLFSVLRNRTIEIRRLIEKGPIL
jgi:hypothetical protein